MAILTGADLIQAGSDSNTKVYGHNTSTVQITEAGKVTLAADDASIYTGNITEYPVYIMLLDDNGEMSGTPVKVESDAITDNVITSTLVKAGDIVMVDYYSEYSEDAIQIEITPDKFAGYFYIEGSTLYRRELDGVDVPAEIIIPKGKIQTSFTFTMAGTGDPSSFDFTVDAFPGYIKGSATQSLAAIQILGADDNYDQVGTSDEETGEVTYARYDYNKDTEGSYLRPSDEPITYNDTTTQNDEELGD
jgi:hypothetical protein